MTHEAAGHDESSGGEHAAHAAAQSRVGWAFFWQSPGAMLPYVLVIPLLFVRRMGGEGPYVLVIPLLFVRRMGGEGGHGSERFLPAA